MGLFKAIRNTVHYLLKDEPVPPASVGDYVMYAFSTARGAGIDLSFSQFSSEPFSSAERAVAALAASAVELLRAERLYAYMIYEALYRASRAAATFDLDFYDCINASLEKLCSH